MRDFHPVLRQMDNKNSIKIPVCFSYQKEEKKIKNKRREPVSMEDDLHSHGGTQPCPRPWRCLLHGSGGCLQSWAGCHGGTYLCPQRTQPIVVGMAGCLPGPTAMEVLHGHHGSILF